MTLTLRPYQEAFVGDIRGALRSHTRVLAEAPTGSGKTAVGTYMIRGAAERGMRAMFLVHRVELLRQTSAAFRRQGVEHGVIAAGEGFNPHHQVHVAAIATLAKRLGRVKRPNMVIVDEAHHAVSKSWADVLAALDPRWTIGLSATPCRLDGRGLGEQFDAIVHGPPVADLITGGFLSRYRVFAPTTVDMTGARTTAGDYNRADSEALVDKPRIVGDVIAHYSRLAAGKRAVVFCVSIRHAEHVAEAFRAAGVPAAAVDGKMAPADRASTLAAFEAGRILVLTSCNLVSEGFDLPSIEAAISLRPTQSLALWLQQVGRCLRPAPGKDHAIILDHCGNSVRHGLPDDAREWSLDGRKKKARKAGEALSLRTCPTCYTIHRPEPTCPSCGHIYAVANRAPEQVDGELGEVDLEALRVRKRQELKAAKMRDDLIRLAAARGYKPGWVDHIMAQRDQWRRERSSQPRVAGWAA